MTVILSAHSLFKSFGTQILFSNLSFTISQGERIGLVGPNGAGKSTLLKILVGSESPNQGHISRRQGLRVGYASQMPEFAPLPLEEVLTREINHPDSTDALTRARILLSKAQFADPTQNASTLSGGWKKRLDIARAMMQEPDLLILDEPTNHLDLEGILWLEKFLLRERIPYVVVSHDRYFLDNVSNKVIELNRCYPQGLFISDGNMSAFMEHREAFLDGQAKQEKDLAAMVKSEVDWLRRSPKARTTKSQSRVDKAYQLMDELSEVKTRNKKPKVDIEFSASERETRKLLTGKNLGKTLGGRTLFKGIDITLSPGTRLGIMGKNGTGKTTLLKILAGLIPQDAGTLKYAENLNLVYFDQHRELISPDITLREALSPTGDRVNCRGQMIHVNGWAKKFLFSPDRLELRVRYLSGGERARLQIAKLMLQPADILFLDEPTNDLDIETLEVIEENLTEFPGAVVLISHDRCLVDRVCNQILGLDMSLEQQYFADYRQWEKAFSEGSSRKESQKSSLEQKTLSSSTSLTKLKKLSYKEQKELEGMESTVMLLEAEIDTLHMKTEDPALQQDAQKSLEAYQLLGEAQQKLEVLYTRWQHLIVTSDE
jgi:ABC transport system ATP-binding/permease protein